MHNKKKYHKAINFDLDYDALKSINKHKNAYTELKKYFEANGFIHRQYSGYVSKTPLTNSEVLDFISQLSKKFSWLQQVIQKIDVTDIGNEWDLTAYIINPSMDRKRVLERGSVESTKTTEHPKSPVEVFRKQTKERQQQAPQKKQKTSKKDNIDL